MEVETTTPSGQPIVDRSKTTPFLIRTFVKIGGFHRLTLFEDGALPTTDEHQIFTWKDATLREVVTTLRNVASHVAEYRHPLAKFSFKTVYADSGNKGRFAQKDLGMVYSRDILGEPGSLNNTAPRLLEDVDGEVREPTEREKEERTLEELRFVPGDYLLASVILPKNLTMPSEAPSKAAAPGGANGWKKSDSGWGSAPAPGIGRGGGHWRGDSNPPPPISRGRGGRGGGDIGRDRDRRVPPPRRRDSPPPRGGWGDRRGGRVDRRSRSRSRSRSPLPRRRNPRYD
ncbi:histone deacetylase complex protein [Amanita rubescens]|nr:histone deacetylase complex protein [Amanita rubescens]